MKMKLLFTVLTAFAFAATANAQLIKTVVAVTGNITNYLDKEPVTVKIDVFNDAGKKITSIKSNSAENGYYYVTGLQPGNAYSFRINNDGFMKENYQVSIPLSDKYIEISRDFVVRPLEENAKLPLPVVPFELNKHKLKFGSAVVLDGIANSLRNNPNVSFEILSYPDNDKDQAHNKELTQKRAQALMDYFVIQGIDPARIMVQGKESTDPVNPPPIEKRAKGKRYIGRTYIVLKSF